MDTPELIAALRNSPGNFLDRISALEQRIQEIQTTDMPPIEEIIHGRTSVFAAWLSPAEGVLVTDPTDVGYTGVFINGNGIEYDGSLYVMGSVINGELKAGFTDTGTLYATDAVISGTITADTGFIGGWEITATTIESLAGGVGISLDSSGPVIQVGDTAGTYIIIDGANEWIRSSNYVAGASGFNIAADSGDAEFNNIVARGELRTFLLTSSNQMAVAGSILVSKDAGKLGADAASGATTVNFGKTLTPGDWIKIQGPDSAGSNSLEWMLIGSNVSGFTYNVTRNVDGSGANNWLKDTPFVVIGASGDSRIELIAGASANLQLITQGATWDSQIVQASMSTIEGAITAGGGSVLLNEDGIYIPNAGDAIEFYEPTNTTYGIISLAPKADGSTSPFNFFSFIPSSETNLLSNGDFETGDLTGWTETDPDGIISVVSGGYANSYSLDFNFNAGAPSGVTQIAQTISATNGAIVSFRARTSVAGVRFDIYPGTGSSNFPIRTDGDWKRYYFVIPASVSTFTLKYQSMNPGSVPSNFGHLYIDDVIVRPLAAGGTSAADLSVAPTFVSVRGRFGVDAPGSLTVGQRFEVGASQISLNMATAIQGSVVINESGADVDVRIEGDTDANLLFVDASMDRIGIGLNNPAYKLDVAGDVNISSGSVFRINGVAVLGSTSNGWTEVSGSWSYASASTITIPTDGTTTYQKGMKIRLKQGAGYKYYVAQSVTATLITVIINTDFTVANAAITDVAYSFIEKPYGWPDWFTFAGTASGSGSMTYTGISTTLSKYKVQGNQITYAISISGTTGGTASNTLQYSVPVGPTVTVAFFAAAATADSGATLGGFSFATTAPLIAVRKPDSSNYGLGASRSMQTVITMEW